jgi:hypothetical protein
MQFFIIVESHSNYSILCFSPGTSSIENAVMWASYFYNEHKQFGSSGWYLSCQHLWQVEQLEAAYE